MKKLLTPFFIIAVVFGYGQERYSINETLIKNKVLCLKVTKEPVTGVVYVSDEKGIVEKETSYKKGKKHGSQIEYYFDGEIHSKDVYSKGEFESQTSNDFIIKESVDGKLSKVKYYHNNKRLGAEVTFKGDKKVVKRWDEEGAFLYDTEFSDQIKDTEIDSIYNVTEQLPSFPGCKEVKDDPTTPNDEHMDCSNQKLFKYISYQTIYPLTARELSLQGRVFVQFVVDKKGMIKDVNVIRGVHQALDNEAVRVIMLMPKWNPGMQKGKAVNCRFTLPFKFKLK